MSVVDEVTAGPTARGTFSYGVEGGTAGITGDSDGNVALAGTLTVTGGVVTPAASGVYVLPASAASAAGTAINAAIAALPAAGGKIIIPTGTWVIDTAILINKSGVVIEGMSNGSSVLSFNPASVATMLAMADTTQRYFQMRNLQIDNAGSAGTGTAIDASYFVNSVFEQLRIGTNVAVNKGIVFNALGTYYNVVRDVRIRVSGASSVCLSFDTVSNSNEVHNARIQGDASTVGVYVNAQNIGLYHIDAETTMSIAIDVGASGDACTIVQPYIEAVATGLRVASGAESCSVIGGQIIDCTTANVTDDGGEGFQLVNVWLQYVPVSSISNGVGAVLYAERSSNSSAVNNSAALASDTQLTVNVPAVAGRWRVEAYIDYDSATAADIKLAWNGPAGASMSWTTSGLASSASGTSGSIGMARSTLGDGGALPAGGAGVGTRVVAHPIGWLLTTGTAGTFVLRWAQNTADPTDTIIYAGSWIRLVREI